MSEKRLYALTDEQAKWLGYYAKVGGYPALDEVLIPLDRDDGVERMARVFADLDPGEPWPTNAELGGGPTGTRDDEYRHEYLDLARGALATLLGTDKDERYKHV